MKKIPTLFVRDEHDRRYVTPVVTPGCEWVLEGEGVATVKWDGTCVMFDGDHWWFRREVKPGKYPPLGWVEVDYDETTGKRVGWEPALPDSSFIKPLREAIDHTFVFGGPIPPLTYELCGPRINGNPEGFDHHVLRPHGAEPFVTGTTWERTFDSLAKILPRADVEGIVFHHPDGRMVKIKARDFPKATTS